MLRIYFWEHWFNLSDPAVEEALYDLQTMRRFVGIDLGREPVPDETTVRRFRHLLEEHDLGLAACSTRCSGIWPQRTETGHRHDCRCHHHQCAILDQERPKGARS